MTQAPSSENRESVEPAAKPKRKWLRRSFIASQLILGFGLGLLITEQVFGWKGMGTLFIEGVRDIDPYPIMGFLVITSVSIIVLNAVADILYAYLDPRIRR